MSDTVSTDSNLRLPDGKRQDKRYADRFAAENDTQRNGLFCRRWADRENDRRAFEFTLTQQVILLERLPIIFFEQQETVTIGFCLECDRAVAHDRSEEHTSELQS